MTYKCEECKDTGLCYDINDLDPVEGYKMADRKIPCGCNKKERTMKKNQNRIVSKLKEILNTDIDEVEELTLVFVDKEACRTRVTYQDTTLTIETTGIQPDECTDTYRGSGGVDMRGTC